MANHKSSLKREAYDKSAEVQFIGHLQTNKVKYS